MKQIKIIEGLTPSCTCIDNAQGSGEIRTDILICVAVVVWYFVVKGLI